MSDLNLEWLDENFGTKELVFFNIGCADITDDTLRFQMALPKARIYSFECADFWKDSNINRSLFFDLHYLHSAVSFFDGHGKFRRAEPSTALQQSSWLGAGNKTQDQTGNDPIQVWNYMGKLLDSHSDLFNANDTAVISLNTFCDQNGLKPDFLHIDTEGEEYNILKFLRADLYPLGIWLENWNHYRDGHNGSVPFAALDAMMQSRSYVKAHEGPNDTLYLMRHLKTTPYRDYRHPVGIPWDETISMSSFEKTIQQRIWLKRYALCKDEAWPELKTPSEFFLLPEKIRQECHVKFNLVPSNSIL